VLTIWPTRGQSKAQRWWAETGGRGECGLLSRISLICACPSVAHTAHVLRSPRLGTCEANSARKEAGTRTRANTCTHLWELLLVESRADDRHGCVVDQSSLCGVARTDSPCCRGEAVVADTNCITLSCGTTTNTHSRALGCGFITRVTLDRRVLCVCEGKTSVG
jgi:hypothetical protein